ncbi:MAG: single-stranded DNA-binding protein [Lachnospiraceae bacterium]|nr:single-stranded DNA-binding protein [Lachnospiraceae bacterium]
MNKIILIGRLTADPEISYSQKEPPVTIARYSLAVDKRKKRDDGVKADFFRLVALGRTGEFAEKYLRKGMKIAVTGHVQTGSYENRDGIKMPFFEVFVEEQEFAESKKASEAAISAAPQSSQLQAPYTEQREEGSNHGQTIEQRSFMFMNPEDFDEDLPFN